MTNNRVWIELEVGNGHAINETRAELMTNLLKRLGAKKTCEWDHAKGMYILRDDVDGGFRHLGDKGEWFNLDYFGRS